MCEQLAENCCAVTVKIHKKWLVRIKIAAAQGSQSSNLKPICCWQADCSAAFTQTGLELSEQNLHFRIYIYKKLSRNPAPVITVVRRRPG